MIPQNTEILTHLKNNNLYTLDKISTYEKDKVKEILQFMHIKCNFVNFLILYTEDLSERSTAISWRKVI